MKPTHRLLVLAFTLSFSASALMSFGADAACALGTWKQVGRVSLTPSAADFVNAKTGWAVGSRYIYKTTNGGKTWRKQKSGVKSNLLAIDALNTKTAFVVGEKGVVLKTTNAGKKWTRKKIGGGASLQGVAFVSTKRGYVCGSTGTKVRTGVIYTTTDGGKTWKRRFSRKNMEFRRVCANGKSRAWALDVSIWLSSRVVYTTNAGKKWRTVSTGVATPRTLISHGSKRLLLMAFDGWVGRSVDGGKTWSKSQITPAPAGWIMDVGYADSNTLWAVGGNPWPTVTEAWVYRSKDGGATWTRVLFLQRRHFQVLKVLGRARALALEQDGGVYAYYDPTQVSDTYTRWKKRTSGTKQTLMAVDFVDWKRGWAVGYGGTILRTVDGGTHWSAQRSGVDCDLRGVDFVNAKAGWAVGYDHPNNRAVILHTTNGGKSWSAQSHPSPLGSWPTDVFATSTQNAWGVGGAATPAGTLFSTNNGGASWASGPGGIAADMYGASRPIGSGATMSAWAVGFPNAMLRTMNGGASWSPVPHGGAGTERLTGAAFATTTRGIIVGDSSRATTATGLVLRTMDGGTTWTRPALPTERQLRDALAMGKQFWIVGDAGVNYRSGNSGSLFRPQKSPPGTAELWGISAVTTKRLCAVGREGTILIGSR